MSGTHPDILYRLQQIRAQELQQAAACARLVEAQNPIWRNGQQSLLSSLRMLMAKAVILFPTPIKKPVAGCC